MTIRVRKSTRDRYKQAAKRKGTSAQKLAAKVLEKNRPNR